MCWGFGLTWLASLLWSGLGRMEASKHFEIWREPWPSSDTMLALLTHWHHTTTTTGSRPSTSRRRRVILQNHAGKSEAKRLSVCCKGEGRSASNNACVCVVGQPRRGYTGMLVKPARFGHRRVIAQASTFVLGANLPVVMSNLPASPWRVRPPHPRPISLPASFTFDAHAP